MNNPLRNQLTIDLPQTLEDLEKGVHRQHLYFARERFLQLNQHRLTRTRDALPQRQRVVLDILPLLFHINHPALPGYVSPDTPSGVPNYSPSPLELEDARRLAKGFRWKAQQDELNCDIHALFMMGSPGTVAHSGKSDIDMWVCHKPNLDTRYRINLEQKCQLITTWADKLGLEIHFFLIDPERFCSGEIESLSEESSGSAQHYLLLEEFYRTAVWVAGRTPLWWYVPASMDHCYEEYTQTLLEKRGIDRRDVIDLGGLSEIPPEEFIGAAVWQLYKSIDSPYKSLLKLLLLEIYAREYPDCSPLCRDFKRLMHSGQQYVNDVDPYILTYRRIENYLNEQHQSERLELVRRCFYFKIDKPLTKTLTGSNKSWQRRQLENMTQDWGWNMDTLRQLDARDEWKADIVVKERNALVAELIRGYKLISRFSQQNQSQARISKQELAILGRKLHAAFERRSGKLERINPGIAPDLSEAYLTVARIGEDDSDCSWEVFNVNPTIVKQGKVKPLKTEPSLLGLLGWCQLNGILAENTRCEVMDDPELSAETARLRHLLSAWLPDQHSHPSHTAFTQRSFVRSLLVIANIGLDPQAELSKLGMQRLSSQSDSLAYSGLRESLVLSLDSIAQTSWHEYVAQHFANNPVVDALMYYLSLSTPKMPPPELEVRSLGSHRSNVIQQRLVELFTDVATWYHNPSKYPALYIFEEAQNFHILRMDGDWPQVTTHNGHAQLLTALSTPHHQYTGWNIDRHALRNTALPLIADVMKPETVQIFYQYNTNGALLLLVQDENGSLFQQSFSKDHPAILPQLKKFLANVVKYHSLSGNFFSAIAINTFEIILRGKRPINLEQQQLKMLPSGVVNEIKVTLTQSPNNTLFFNLHCDNKEFTQLDLGDDLYLETARYLLEHTKEKALRPCFVTDLNINDCDRFIDSRNKIQASHHLRIKAEVERKLNRAINQIRREKNNNQ